MSFDLKIPSSVIMSKGNGKQLSIVTSRNIVIILSNLDHCNAYLFVFVYHKSIYKGYEI